jgi:hypothetical protein
MVRYYSLFNFEKSMIIDEKELGQRFLIDLLRMEGKGELKSTTESHVPQSFDGNIEDILLEIELSDPEINEDMNDPDIFLDFLDYPQVNPEPIVAITKHPLSDSSKNWKISKVIIGTRRCYSA